MTDKLSYLYRWTDRQKTCHISNMEPEDIFDPPTQQHGITLSALAARMKMSRRQLTRWVAAGKLRAFKRRGVWMVSELEAQRVTSDLSCEICGAKKRRLGADHCHRTGWPRGMLCTQCNTGLGMFRDDERLLQLAIEYVRRHRVAAKAGIAAMTDAERHWLGADEHKRNPEKESTTLDIPCPTCSAIAGKWCSAPFQTSAESLLGLHTTRLRAWGASKVA